LRGGGGVSSAVVTVQHRPLRARVHALGQRGALEQLSGMIRFVEVMHRPADDLAAVEIEDEIEDEQSLNRVIA
jgi:hypothetical protein